MTDQDFVDIVTLLRSPDRFEPHTCNAAADEIERLRRRLLAEENAYDIERRQNEHLQTDRNNLALEIERLRVIVQGWDHSARNAERDMETLRAERDEARRELCRHVFLNGGIPPQQYAAVMGWDCFGRPKQ